MRRNIIVLNLLLMITSTISSQDRIKIGEEKAGEFSLPELQLTDSTLINGLNYIFSGNPIDSLPFISNGIFLVNIEKQKRHLKLKIETAYLGEDFSQSCIGYFSIRDKILFFRKNGCQKKIKITDNIKMFDFYETVLIEPSGDKRPLFVKREPTFYIFELTKKNVFLKEQFSFN